MKPSKVALYASIIGVMRCPSISHLYLKNLTTKILQLNVIAFLQGKQFVYPKRIDSRENLTSILVTSQIQLVRVLQSGKIRLQYQKRCSTVSGFLS